VFFQVVADQRVSILEATLDSAATELAQVELVEGVHGLKAMSRVLGPKAT